MKYLRSITYIPEQIDFDTGEKYEAHVLIRVTQQLENPRNTTQHLQKIYLDVFPEVTEDFIKILSAALCPKVKFEDISLRILSND